MAASLQIVSDAPLRGRPTAVDIEERTPAGRAAHRQEEYAYAISATSAGRRDTRPLWSQCDGILDGLNRDNEAIRDRLALHPDPEVRALAIRLAGNCAEYWRFDGIDDEIVLGHYDAFETIHAYARRIAGFFERLCAAIRGRR